MTTIDTSSIYEQAKIEQKDTSNPSFWKNKIISHIEKEKNNANKRNLTQEKEENILQDIRKNIQNLSKQAKSSCIHEKNKRIMSFQEKKIPKNIQKEINHYKSLEGKWRRIEQTCMRGIKKRTIRNLINGNLLKSLINQPENNRFEYTSKTSKKIYDVMVLEKENEENKIIYQVETVGKKPFRFAISIDKDQESDTFRTSSNTLIIEGLDEIEKIIKDLLNKIPG